MYKKLMLRRKIPIFIILVITAIHGFLLLSVSDGTNFKDIPELVIIMFSLIILFIVVSGSCIIYSFRLKRFVKELGEASLDAVLRKGYHRIDEKYYWFKEYFLDLTRLKRVYYGDITHLKASEISISPFADRENILKYAARKNDWRVHMFYLKIRYKHKSIKICTGVDPKYCRYAINLFKQKNKNIKIKDSVLWR